MEREEESQLQFKEGRGQIIRPENANFSYYHSLSGTWVRGVLHGKRVDYNLNLKVFPRGYYANSMSKTDLANLKSLKISTEVRKGIMNGPASIIINGKKLCSTRL